MLRRIVFFVLLIMSFYAQTAEPLDKVVAVVNDGVITSSELDTHVEETRKQLAAKSMQIPEDRVLRKQVLQHLIDVDLQLQLAKKNDISIDNIDLNDAIVKIAAANHLSLTQLREAVVNQGLGWSTYRENVRKEMLISRLQQKAVSKELVISAQQVEDYIKTTQQEENKAQQTYSVQNIVIPFPEEPTTEQLNMAKQKAAALLLKIKQGEDFSRLAITESSGEFALEGGDLGARHLAQLPDIFAKEVVHMKAGEVVGPLRAGNGYQLIKLVAIGGGDGRHEVTKTHVRHILLKPGSSMTEAEAKKQADNLYQQLQSGKDFSLMAKQYSLDIVSGSAGGDLGWVSPGELVPEFEEAMDALSLGKVSKPVKTVFGWHLIEVIERKTVDDTESFKRVQVRQFLQQRKFTEAVQNWQQHLRAEAYVHVVDKKLA